MLNNIIKIIACLGISSAMVSMVIANPSAGGVALIIGGLIMWGISAS